MDRFQDRGNLLFKQVHEGKSLKGRSNDAISSACLYIACRQEGVPRTFKGNCFVCLFFLSSLYHKGLSSPRCIAVFWFFIASCWPIAPLFFFLCFFLVYLQTIRPSWLWFSSFSATSLFLCLSSFR